ncbi:MAG: ABC transporter ATP-binding protein [Caldilineaceae bacterium]|nr:ABC transporter ATP-binding protein [Caldilineaceae bacterium]
MRELLTATSVTKEYITGGGLLSHKKMAALQDFSLKLQSDQPAVLAVAGESGSGKTTLARLLLGIAQPTSGSVTYKGRDLRAMSRSERMEFRREVQAVFQDPFEVYNPFYKVDHVLTTPLAKFGLADSKADATRQIHAALEQVGLRPEETLGRYPHQVSGGQRQRIMVARALLLRPRILLADEPVSMVDASLRATILESLLKLHQEHNISLLYITHDLTTAYQLCEEIIILYRGNVVESGSVDLVIKEPQHPYTQLLVNSIPLPDPNRRWGEDDTSATQAATPSSVGTERGCKFAGRCPHVMDACLRAQPPLLPTDPRRAVACYLYEDHQQEHATNHAN